MAKLTLDVILKVAQIASNILIVLIESVTGRDKNDSSRSSEKK